MDTAKEILEGLRQPVRALRDRIPDVFGTTNDADETSRLAVIRSLLIALDGALRPRGGIVWVSAG
jgi:hypothetical protein